MMNAPQCRPAITALVAGAVAFAAPLGALGQDLPPAIHVARHLLQAETYMQAGDARAALAALDRILELRAEHDVEIPDVFWFRHAQAARAVGHAERAETSVIRYLELTPEEAEHYQAALELYNEAEAERLEEELRLAEETRLAVDAKDVGDP